MITEEWVMKALGMVRYGSVRIWGEKIVIVFESMNFTHENISHAFMIHADFYNYWNVHQNYNSVEHFNSCKKMYGT